MHGWQANKKRTCAQPVKFRVIPENEIPRVSTRGFLLNVLQLPAAISGSDRRDRRQSGGSDQALGETEKG